MLEGIVNTRVDMVPSFDTVLIVVVVEPFADTTVLRVEFYAWSPSEATSDWEKKDKLVRLAWVVVVVQRPQEFLADWESILDAPLLAE